MRRLVDAYNRVDLEAMEAISVPDVELHEWPEAPGARAYHGAEGLRQALDSWFESWEWMQVEIEGIVDLGDRVLMTLHQRAKGRGSSVEVDLKSFNVVTVRDSKVARLELFIDEGDALRAAGLTGREIASEEVG